VDVGALVRRCWATPEPETARTYGELAEKLGMSCADPERTLKAYHARGMPGKVATRGKQDGRFDVEECRDWIAIHVQGGAAGGGSKGELRERILQLELEILERDKLESLERLVDVDEAAAFATSCVANSKAILEAIPDQVLAGLEGIGEARRRSIFKECEKLIDTAFEELAHFAEGDTDPTEEEESAAPAGNRKAARKGKRRVAAA
jgi:hypothetical protein